ncbi:hypothetical protein HFK83_03390 [Ralstonia pseudosolanacearum]|uniref:hypothetical protein n=1 Tax=Ralstonia solanacearum species complex TaxID=3116862 RepID=UPI00200469B8|nr:hypothetical protein [Ralstonia pseudosolanacearum]MCK4121414.1 hypothetical protein [Ralstonia pseudosolanacearum]
MKRVLVALLLCLSVTQALAQFVSGQVLTASGLNAALSQKVQASDLGNSSDPTKGAALVGYGGGTVASALNATALQFVTSAGSANIKPNTSYSAILPTASVATITGGGDPADTQLIGYTKATNYFLGAGSSYTFNALPTTGNVSDLKLTRKIADGTVAVLTYTSGTPTGTQWAGSISGGTVAITLGTALNSGEYIRAEDPYAAIATTGQAPSYGSIHGGYDNSTQSGLMNHIVSSAHSHIDDQDGTPGHVMIFGGSANYITGAIAYSSILAGTGNEIRSGATNGSVVLGGIYTKVSGTTAAALACERCKVSSVYGFAQGQSENVSGTASGALGRGHTVSGANALATGQNGVISADNSTGHGNTYTLSHPYSFNAAGYKTRSIAPGDVIFWGYRDSSAGYAGGSAGTNPMIQNHRVYWNGYWADTSTHLMTNAYDDTTTDIPITAGAVTLYRIFVNARGGSLKGGAWVLTCAIQAPSTLSSGTPATIIGGSCTSDFSQVDAGLGTSTNAASVSAAVNSSTGAGLQITAKQRADTAVGTKWAAVVEILEVN